MPSASDAAFVKAVIALGPYLGQLVIVGAWAHRLYRLHPLAVPPEYEPLMTRDADFAAPERVTVHGDRIPDLLLAAGFREQLKGDPPVATYHPAEPGGLYVEFIAPLTGSETDRRGVPKRASNIAGALAPRLRYVDLLVNEPWELRLTSESGLPVEPPGVDVRVAHPVAYLAQKVLSAPKRRAQEKRAKDLLYLADTLTLFGGRLAELRAPAARVVAELHPTTRKDFARLCVEFPSIAAVAKGASVIAEATGRPAPFSPERISTLCRIGLLAIFGPNS